MADKIVIDALRKQLERDAKAALAQVGDAWSTLPLSFYYGSSPAAEISIDLAMKATMLRILEADQASLPNKIWNRLRTRINGDTVVDDAAETLSRARDAET